MLARTHSILNDDTAVLRQIVYQKVLIRQLSTVAAPFDSGILDALRNKKRQVVIRLFSKEKGVCVINIFSGTMSAEYYIRFADIGRIVGDDAEMTRELQDYLSKDRRIVIEHEDASSQILMHYLKRVT